MIFQWEVLSSKCIILKTKCAIMKKLPKYIVLCLSVFFLSCAKEELAPEGGEGERAELITEVASISYSNLTVDTVWVDMEAFEQTFTPAITHLDLGDVYDEVKDSVFIDIDLPSSLRIDEELSLPTIHITDPYVLFNTKEDSLLVDNFPYQEGFHSAQRWEITEQYDGLIEKIKINRKYERIYYKADVRVVIIDENGNSYVQEGKFIGSRMGQSSTDIAVW